MACLGSVTFSSICNSHAHTYIIYMQMLDNTCGHAHALRGNKSREKAEKEIEGAFHVSAPKHLRVCAQHLHQPNQSLHHEHVNIRYNMLAQTTLDFGLHVDTCVIP